MIVGVDGARGGWALATGVRRPGVITDIEVTFAETLDALVAAVRAHEVEAVAIDMPIGLLNAHPRPADVLARTHLGHRRSSVFPTPLRVTLDASDYEDACARSRSASGKALSKQAFNLLPKIRELDSLIEANDQDRIVEAHPELSFARLAGAPLGHPKASADGRQLRIDLLTEALGPLTAESMTAVPITDALDALANLITASHIAAGTATRLGGEVDPTGKRCEIAW